MKESVSLARIFVPASVLLCVAMTVPAAGASSSPAAQDATDQATIATANATAANALASAQAALLSTQLANQKAEIANAQAAFAQPDPSKLRMTGALSVPTVNALYNRVLSQSLDDWLKGQDANPKTALDALHCSSILLYKPSISALSLAYRATDAKLLSIWKSLTDATNTLNALTRVRTKPVNGPKPAEVPPPTSPAGGGSLVGIAVATELLNFGLNLAAAAKTQTALGSSANSSAAKIVTASVMSHLSGVTDPDLIVAVGNSGAATPVCGSFAALQDGAMSLEDKLTCVNQALGAANVSVTKAIVALPPAPDPKTYDPNGNLRIKAAELTTQATQASVDLLAMFTPDKASGVVPFLSAVQGRIVANALAQEGTCLLSINTMSSDADSLVRDGTFSRYRLYAATTTAITWQVSTPAGLLRASGFKALTTDWTKQDLKD